MFTASGLFLLLSSNLLDLIYSRLGESAIAELLRTNVVGFTSNKIRVEMSSGPGYPKILLMATEFVPSNREFLSLSYVAHVATADYPRFLPSYAPPLGVYGTGKIDLKKLCLSHINSIIEQGHSPTECELGDTSRISWKVFDAVNRYRKLRSRTGGNVSILDCKRKQGLIVYILGRLTADRLHAACDTSLHEPNDYFHPDVS